MTEEQENNPEYDHFKEAFGQYQFKRIPEIYASNPQNPLTLFQPEGPDGAPLRIDFKDGFFGNYTFASVLGILNSYPKYIQKIIETKEFNNEAVFDLDFSKNGIQ